VSLSAVAVPAFRFIAVVLSAASLMPMPMPAADTTLLDAAQSGDHAAALRLASAKDKNGKKDKKDTNVNATGADGATAVMYASANNDPELVRALIKAGANVKLTNQFGTSALTEAAIVGSAPIIDALLKAGADPNFRTPDGETPLMAAARSGKVDAAKLLLAAGADINAKETWGGQSAIMWAAAQNHPGTSSEGPEQGRFYPAALCRARGLRGLRSEPADGRRGSRLRRSGPRNAAATRAGEYAFRYSRRARHRC